MAVGPQDIQYYDGKFITNEGNLVYQNIINCMLYKPPYFNDSFRNLFAQSPFDKGDKTQFFVNKRAGFTKVPMFAVSQDTSDRTNPHVTDMRIVDGKRYFIVLNDIKTKLRIYKQTAVNDLGPCDNSCLNDIDEGSIINMTSYKGKDYFPFLPCLYDRFVLTTHVKGKKKDSGLTGIIRVNKMGDTYFSSITDEDGLPINAEAGDYIYIDNGKGVTGYVVQVAGKAGALPTGSMEIDSDAIMINGTRVPGINMAAADGTPLDDNSVDKISYIVYKDYGLTLHRVTSDGIFHWNYDNDTPTTFERSYAGDTYFDTQDNTLENPKQIYCMTHRGDAFSYLDGKTGILGNGGLGRMKFSFKPQDNMVTNGLYTRMQEYMGYLILLGPDNIGYFIKDRSTGITTVGSITESNGYRSQNAFNTADENFFLIRKSHDFYQMGLQSSYSYNIPVRYFTYMNNFLNTDLGMLVRGIDTVSLDVQDNKFRVFINNGGGNTKLMIFDRYYNLRHKRYIQGCDMNRMCDGVFLGRGIFKNVGTTDNGNPITQIVTMTWGDEGHTANKKIEFVKLPIGYNSYIEKGLTAFTSTTSDGGRKYETVYSDWGRSDYVSNLMKGKITPDLDNQAIEEVNIYEVGITVNNCLGSRAGIELFDTYNEFNSYIDYGAQISIDSDSEEEMDVCIGKMGILKIALGQWGEVFTFEIVARGNNKVEFGGFFLGYQYSDVDITRLENTLTLGDLTTNCGRTPDVNINNQDQLLGITP